MYKYTMGVLLRARSYPFGTGIGGKSSEDFCVGKQYVEAEGENWLTQWEKMIGWFISF